MAVLFFTGQLLPSEYQTFTFPIVNFHSYDWNSNPPYWIITFVLFIVPSATITPFLCLIFRHKIFNCQGDFNVHNREQLVHSSDSLATGCETQWIVVVSTRWPPPIGTHDRSGNHAYAFYPILTFVPFSLLKLLFLLLVALRTIILQYAPLNLQDFRSSWARPSFEVSHVRILLGSGIVNSKFLQ